MMHKVSTIITCTLLATLVWGCKPESDPPKGSSYFEFQIAIRKEGPKQEPSLNSGTYQVVSTHHIPVTIGAGPEKTSSVDQQGIWVDFRWNSTEKREGRLWFYGLQYRIRNELLFEGSGGKTGWDSTSGIGIDPDWQHLNSLTSLASDNEGNLLYHRLRWTNPQPPYAAIEMHEATRTEGNRTSSSELRVKISQMDGNIRHQFTASSY